MKILKVVPAVALSLGMLAAPIATTSASASPAGHHHHHVCTRTSSGTCIQGGEFCPQADYGKSGWDANGRRYVCKGDREHPHWEIPNKRRG